MMYLNTRFLLKGEDVSKIETNKVKLKGVK